MIHLCRDAWRVLSVDDRRRGILLLCALLLATALETIGVGLLLPVLGLLANPGSMRGIPFLGRLVPDDGGALPVRAMLAVSVSVIGFYVAKAFYLAWVTRHQMAFAFRVQADLSRRAFASSLLRPYAFHLRTNSADLISRALGEVQVFTQGVMISGLGLLAETLVLCSISALLLAVEPIAATTAAVVLGSMALGFQLVVRRRLRIWGERRPLLEAERLRHLQQGLLGAKEVILAGREEEFVRRYDASNRGVAMMLAREKALAQVPRFALEVLAVASVLVVVSVLLVRGAGMAEIVPRVALFAAACFRLAPSLNRVSTTLHSLRFSAPAAHALARDLGDAACVALPEPRPHAWHGSIRMHGVSFRYEGSASDVLSGVELEIRRGERVGIVGASGSGKSTLVNLLIGLLDPSTGSITVDQGDIRSFLRSWRAQVGYVPQSVALSDDDLESNIAFGIDRNRIDRERVAEVARLARIDGLLAGQAGRRAGERGARLSGGQIQRIGIARALYRRPSLLVLDEATSALDEATEAEVLESVAALPRNVTVILIAHRGRALSICDRVVRVDAGGIHAPSTSDSIAGSQVRA